jgi:hypothetical protein
MAVRRETVKKQFGEALANGGLEPGEQIVAGVLSQSGPTPWLTGAIGLVFMLLLGMKYYFIAVTDRRVLFAQASLMSARPKGVVAWADPLGAGVVSDVDASAKLWSHFRYQRPGQPKATRFNVHRVWREDLQQVLAAMQAGPGSQPVPPAILQSPPTPPPPPPA